MVRSARHVPREASGSCCDCVYEAVLFDYVSPCWLVRVTLKPWGEVCELIPLCQVPEVFASFIPFSHGVVARVVPGYADDYALSWCLSVLQLAHSLDVVESILVELYARHVLRVALVVSQQVYPYLWVWWVIWWQAHSVDGVLGMEANRVAIVAWCL